PRGRPLLRRRLPCPHSHDAAATDDVADILGVIGGAETIAGRPIDAIAHVTMAAERRRPKMRLEVGKRCPESGDPHFRRRETGGSAVATALGTPGRGRDHHDEFVAALEVGHEPGRRLRRLVAEPMGSPHAATLFVDGSPEGVLDFAEPRALERNLQAAGADRGNRKALEVLLLEMKERVAEEVGPHAAETPRISLCRARDETGQGCDHQDAAAHRLSSPHAGFVGTITRSSGNSAYKSCRWHAGRD